MQLFQTWFYEADEADSIDEANAMSVSTIGLDGFPKHALYYSNNTLTKGLYSTPTTTAKKVEL